LIYIPRKTINLWSQRHSLSRRLRIRVACKVRPERVVLRRYRHFYTHII
jgi:hypothetical protein